MHISPAVEVALIELAEKGLWLKVHDGRMQVIATRPSTGIVTDALRAQIVSQRAELLEVIPALEMPEKLALTGSEVRVLFARLPGELQNPPQMSPAEFSSNYDDLTIDQRVQYLWYLMDGPLEARTRRKEGIAA